MIIFRWNHHRFINLLEKLLCAMFIVIFIRFTRLNGTSKIVSIFFLFVARKYRVRKGQFIYTENGKRHRSNEEFLRTM